MDVLAHADDWIVVNKPTRLLVHRQPGVRETAAVQVLRDQIGARVWPIHRLDRATSGCLIFALSREAIAPLHDALAAGTKHYLAQVRGNLAEHEPIEVDDALVSKGRERESHTTFHRLAGASEPRSSLVLAQPRTGRFHQVRRHLVRLSHPVLGDSTHGDTRVNRWWRENQGLDRLALHCWQITLTLPKGDTLQVRAPIPDDLIRVWEAQPWWSDAESRLQDWVQEAA